MFTRDDNPKVFISYSWSNPEHEEFIRNLAEKLMADGVYVILDKWDLKEGHDKYSFMEMMVTDETISKVLIISDKVYAIKADAREGGVGTESQIVSSEVYSKVNQDKFIPIVTEFENGNPYLPTFLKSRIYINLAHDETYYDEYDKLLRNIYERPEIVKPMIGKAPSYLFDDTPVNLDTISIFQHLKNAIEKEKSSSKKLGNDFLNQILASLENIRITEYTDDIDDKIIETITKFKPYRNQFVEYINLLCVYEILEDREDALFSFFESLLNLHDVQEFNIQSNESLFINYKFISYEMFLYFITVLIKSKEYNTINYFLDEKYYKKGIRGQSITTYYEFNCYLHALDEHRKQRLKLSRVSITADILHDSADIKGISFDDIMQTDFILTLRGLLHQGDESYFSWFPRTLVYKSGYNFELFLRAESKHHFEIVKKLLLVNSKEDLTAKFKKAEKKHNLENWSLNHYRIPFANYLNLKKLYDAKT